MPVLKGIFGGSPEITFQNGNNPKGLKKPEKILRVWARENRAKNIRGEFGTEVNNFVVLVA